MTNNQVDWLEPLPEELVDRQEQLDDFDEVLTLIQRQRSLSTRLFEWYGGPGIGKTQLVRLLIELCKKKDCTWAEVNFRKSPVDQFMADPSQLIEHIAKNLIGEDRLQKDPLEKHLALYRKQEPPSNAIDVYYRLTRNNLLYERPDWVENLRNIVSSFIGLVNSLGRSPDDSFTRPVVIIFDETEYSFDKLTVWIEEWIISPLLSLKHCVIVWTARAPWNWHLPEIRRCVRSDALHAFPSNETANQLQKRSSEPDLAAALFSRVHEITHGHPAANAVALKQIDEWSMASSPLDQLSEERKAALLHEIFNRFILSYAFGHLQSDEKEAIQLLAMVRWFDPVMLKAVLQAAGSPKFKKWSQLDFGYFFQKLKQTQLLVWKKGLTLDPTLRRIIYDYYLTAEPSLYVLINQTALEVYGQWLERQVIDPNLYVGEELFHWASLRLAGQNVSPERELQKRLESYREWIPDPERRKHTLGLLKGELEQDKELQQLAAELSIPPFDKQVQSFLEQHSEEVVTNVS